MCIARPVMTGPATVFALASFLGAATAYWDEERRLAVEKAILGLTVTSNDTESESALEHIRNRLLMSLPVASFQTEPGKALREQLANSERPPRNEPLISFTTEWNDVTTEEFLRERGTAVDQPSETCASRGRRTLEPIKTTIEKEPSPERFVDAVNLMRLADDQLNQHPEADPKVKTNLLTQLSSAAVQLVRNFQKLSEEQAAFVRAILLRASEDTEPTFDEEHDSKWEHASWSPAPRNDAAQGVAWLLLLRADDEKAKAAVRRLSSDPVPSVRFLIAMELFRLHRLVTIQNSCRRF